MKTFLSKFKKILSTHLKDNVSFRVKHLPFTYDKTKVLKRYSRQELKRISKNPCPVQDPTKQSDSIKDMKILRRQFRINQQNTCKKCPHVQTCPAANIIPGIQVQPQFWTVTCAIQSFYKYYSAKELKQQSMQQEVKFQQLLLQSNLLKVLDNIDSVLTNLQTDEYKCFQNNQIQISRIYQQKIKKMQQQRLKQQQALQASQQSPMKSQFKKQKLQQRQNVFQNKPGEFIPPNTQYYQPTNKSAKQNQTTIAQQHNYAHQASNMYDQQNMKNRQFQGQNQFKNQRSINQSARSQSQNQFRNYQNQRQPRSHQRNRQPTNIHSQNQFRTQRNYQNQRQPARSSRSFQQPRQFNKFSQQTRRQNNQYGGGMNRNQGKKPFRR